MPGKKPAALLDSILEKLQLLLADDASLNPQQKTFIRHMHNTAQKLHAIAREIPSTDSALRQILPALGDDFLQPQQALVGYAKMLIEHPESFHDADDSAELTPAQRRILMQIHDESVSLYRLTERIREEAFNERRDQRTADPADFDLNMLIWQHVPVYRYWLKDNPVTVTVNFPAGLPPVHAQGYHLAEAVQHFIVTMGRDLVEQGNIQISADYILDDNCVSLKILCPEYRFTLDDFDVLFKQNGRDVYLQRLQEQNILLHAMSPSEGAAIYLDIPAARRFTS
jgi:hypothetical protein